jgi:2-amino-4-hydroxy-6-hydroxymethyldihydropteridine diphosphokinase
MERNTHTVYLGLGANLGDRHEALRSARDMLGPKVELTACSSLYETPPWGLHAQPTFLNAVCATRTQLSPFELLSYVKDLERQLGRVASVRWGPRAIDIDILLFDDLVLHSKSLIIPHPHLHHRAFVLVPLAELAPQLLHPTIGQTIQQLVDTDRSADIKLVAQNW